ncbi:MAG TPA: hypothetical protein VLA88_03495 [Candidatus Saccharimonadales bacterium]|nr:hypothetical protein [Candidatus Saccharimonadales bacterium]
MRKRTSKNYLFIIGRVVTLTACGLISLFLVLSGYESIFNKDLPLVHTLDSVNLTALSKRYDLPKAVAAQTPEMFGNFGKPQTLKLPERALRLDITAPITDGSGGWLARANTLHSIVLKEPRRGNIGLLVLYCRSSFRTISTTALPAAGENIFMDTDKNWRYIYRVSSSKVVPAYEQYVVSDNGQTGRIVIFCYDATSNVDAVVEATILSVQGVTQ